MASVLESTAHRRFGITDDHAPWCREVVNFDERDDAVPCVNGVSVGQRWQNVHTRSICTVTQIRLAGLGSHTAHYESIVLLPDGVSPDKLDSGWALWSIGEHWQLLDENDKRVEPQPIVWPNRDVVPVAAVVCRVRHDRPVGSSVSWVGERRTRWRFYDNGIITCDGLVIGNASYTDDQDEYLLRRYPLCTPGPTAAREQILQSSVGSLASRWNERKAA